MPENRPNLQPSTTQTVSSQIEKDTAAQTAPSSTQPLKTPRPARTTGGGTGIENAVKKSQEKAQREAEKRDLMWGRIAKAVDDAIGAEVPRNIETHNIDHIVKAILDYAPPKAQLVEETSQRRKNEIDKSVIQDAESLTKSNEAALLPEKQNT